MMREVRKAYASSRNIHREYVSVAVALGLVTVVGWFTPLSYTALGYIYLLAVIALSLRISRWPALVAALLSGVAWNFFFVPPRLSFSIVHFDESLLLTTYFAVALIAGQLAALRSRADRAQLLAESERMHQTLLDSVSHELKTPVAVFRSAVEQLSTSDPAKRDLLMAELRIALERLDTIVGHLLNQTRLESGVLRPKLDWCDARDLVSAARRAVGSRLRDHPLTVDIPFDFPIFLADAALMEEAIANLLTNAATHTLGGTRIWVSAEANQGLRRLFISVSDEGPGVPEALREKIFDKFSRGLSPQGAGLGLGLSIVRGFMLAQGGDVAVDSAPAGGARFTLSIPHVGFAPAPTA